MQYIQESEYEVVQYRFGAPYLRALPKERTEPYFVFEPGDFHWTAADIEFNMKLWFYHWILYGDSDIYNKPIRASFVYWVRSKCSCGREENNAARPQ